MQYSTTRHVYTLIITLLSDNWMNECPIDLRNYWLQAPIHPEPPNTNNTRIQEAVILDNIVTKENRHILDFT